MTVLQFVLFLAVAGIAGAIGQALAGYSRGGCLARSIHEGDHN